MTLDPAAVLAALNRHAVRYVLIGGQAAVIHGHEGVTLDVDITPEASGANIARLSDALRELEARIRVEGIEGGLAFDHDAASLARANVWNLTTSAGDLDINFVPDGTTGYDDLARSMIRIVVHDVEVPVAALADVIRSKEAAGRARDRAVLPQLRKLLAQQERRRR